MGAQAAAYQVAFAAEAAVLKPMVYVAGLLVLVKAFESVPHAVLAAAAKAKGPLMQYPVQPTAPSRAATCEPAKSSSALQSSTTIELERLFI